MIKLTWMFGLFLSFLLSFSISFAAKAEVPDDYKQMKNSIILSSDQVTYWRGHFLAQCSRCHGDNGDGGKKVEKGFPQPVDFTDGKFMSSKTDGELFYQIEMGGEDDSAMPDFGPDSAMGWDDDKIWQMVAFIRLFSK